MRVLVFSRHALDWGKVQAGVSQDCSAWRREGGGRYLIKCNIVDAELAFISSEDRFKQVFDRSRDLTAWHDREPEAPDIAWRARRFSHVGGDAVWRQLETLVAATASRRQANVAHALEALTTLLYDHRGRFQECAIAILEALWVDTAKYQYPGDIRKLVYEHVETIKGLVTMNEEETQLRTLIENTINAEGAVTDLVALRDYLLGSDNNSAAQSLLDQIGTSEAQDAGDPPTE